MHKLVSMLPTGVPSLVEVLRRVALFNELSAAELNSVAERASVRQYKAGEIVFSEGEGGGDLLIVKTGIPSRTALQAAMEKSEGNPGQV